MLEEIIYHMVYSFESNLKLAILRGAFLVSLLPKSIIPSGYIIISSYAAYMFLTTHLQGSLAATGVNLFGTSCDKLREVTIRKFHTTAEAYADINVLVQQQNSERQVDQTTVVIDRSRFSQWGLYWDKKAKLEVGNMGSVRSRKKMRTDMSTSSL
ncbi:hypothetical protein KIN20_037246 [Parelaphostrongylus tenuis]|uniref:Uncharacterized protein n=1 Tax=Parelaphostrongylus tenuis TaxID=148309 RepID=A0AAD5REG2_PARTN|nr:hypothetical protein KIN20_037246 [Parelaphostrongylus tenuis]